MSDDKPSILKWLSEERVVSFDLADDRATLQVGERCDDYFWEDLSKVQVGQMIEELQALHREMVDGK